MDVSSHDAHANLHAALPCPDREPVTARLALSELLFEFDSTPSIYSQANPHDVLTFLVATLGPSRSAFASVLSLSVALKHGRRWVLEELPGEGTGAGWEVVLALGSSSDQPRARLHPFCTSLGAWSHTGSEPAQKGPGPEQELGAKRLLAQPDRGRGPRLGPGPGVGWSQVTSGGLGTLLPWPCPLPRTLGTWIIGCW